MNVIFVILYVFIGFIATSLFLAWDYSETCNGDLRSYFSGGTIFLSVVMLVFWPLWLGILTFFRFIVMWFKFCCGLFEKGRKRNKYGK